MGAVSLAALRAQIREIEGSSVEVRLVPSGVALIDELLGGLPAPGWMELVGAPGSGRTRLALALVTAAQREEKWACWVDFEHTFYPPAAAAAGVSLRDLWIVRPPPRAGVWAVEQLARSGVFAMIVVADPPALGIAGARWARAVEGGGATTGVALRTHMNKDIPIFSRMNLENGDAMVSRRRGGVVGQRRPYGREGWS